jgi:predicted aspartyl protease
MDFMLMEPIQPLPGDTAVAGLIGSNILRAYDVEFDFGNRRVNLLSQNHCEGKVIYWPSTRIAVIPIQITETGHVLVPVELDGQRLTALLDTGSNVSALNMEKAQATFGLVPGSAETPSAGELRNGELKVYSHRFHSLSLDGVTVLNPEMTIVPDLLRTKLHDPRDTLEGDTRIGKSNLETGMNDIILGTDILHHLHLYIAYHERKLYISAAQTPSTSLPPTAAVMNVVAALKERPSHSWR